MSFSRFPVQHEEDASGLVASVFRDVLARMEFVPALFKALAADPLALEAAWLQARALYDDPRSHDSVARLHELAMPALPYRPSPAVRAAARPFAAEVPTMLLVTTSLGLALDGVLGAQPKPPLDLPEHGPPVKATVPEERGEHPLFDEVRALYGTWHVPTLFRTLAAQGVLEEPWHGIAPFLGSVHGRALVADVAAAAEEEARLFPGVAFFRSEHTRPVLDQFRTALPRNLVFAAAATR